jgi:hypothetical protein
MVCFYLGHFSINVLFEDGVVFSIEFAYEFLFWDHFYLL